MLHTNSKKRFSSLKMNDSGLVVWLRCLAHVRSWFNSKENNNEKIHERFMQKDKESEASLGYMMII
jgi:hypothetical protein